MVWEGVCKFIQVNQKAEDEASYKCKLVFGFDPVCINLQRVISHNFIILLLLVLKAAG